MSEKIYAQRALKNGVAKVATTDLTKHPWNEKKNGAPAEYFTADPNVQSISVWTDPIPTTPPAASTSIIEKADYAVFFNVESVPDNFRSYVTVAWGGTVNSDPLGSFINPALNGDAYRPKLYYDSGGSTWVEIPYGTFDWQINTSTGVIITTNGALTPSAAGYWKLEGWRYIGQTLDAMLLANGSLAIVQDSGGATVVNNVNDLRFDDSTFAVTDLGGGAAQVSMTGSATQYNLLDQFTATASQTTFTLTDPTKIFAANMGLVTVNGVSATYSVDYTVSNSTNPALNTTINWTGPYTMQVGDIVEVRY